MSLNFYNDLTRENYTAVGFTIKHHWYLEVWTLFPYVLVWFSMSRMLVRRDLHSIFFYIGLMIHEYLGYIYMVPWEISILTHFICFTVMTLRGSTESRTWERTLGLVWCLIIGLLIVASKIVAKKRIHDEMMQAILVGFMTGVCWFSIMNAIDGNMLWKTLLSRRCDWNCMMVRHTRGIHNITLFEYFLTQELNVRRNNIMWSESMVREYYSDGLTAETTM